MSRFLLRCTEPQSPEAPQGTWVHTLVMLQMSGGQQLGKQFERLKGVELLHFLRHIPLAKSQSHHYYLHILGSILGHRRCTGMSRFLLRCTEPQSPDASQGTWVHTLVTLQMSGGQQLGKQFERLKGVELLHFLRHIPLAKSQSHHYYLHILGSILGHRRCTGMSRFLLRCTEPQSPDASQGTWVHTL